MKPTNWKDIAELIGIAAIVASLIFVGMEMRQSQRIAYGEQQGAGIVERMALNEAIARNADLLLKANSDADLSPSEGLALRSLVDSYWFATFFSYQRWYYLDHPGINAPIHGFSRFLFDNPGARETWLADRVRRREIAEVVYEGTAPRAIDLVDKMILDDLEKLDRAFD